MKKHDYLKKALIAGKANNLAWIVSAFCIVREPANAWESEPYLYRLNNTHSKYQFLNDKQIFEDLEDSGSTKEPLFRFLDEIEVGPKDGFANIDKPYTTKIGNLVFNIIAPLPAFGSRFPFQSEKLDLNHMEKLIASRLVDTPKTDEDTKLVIENGKFTVAEYLKFRDALVYMEQFATITSWSATRKGITKPRGLEVFKKQLLDEYGDRINDPAVFAEFEARLLAYDKEYLKDDPAYGKFLKGKVLNVSRKKLFLSIGMPDRLDTTEPQVPVTRSLEEGQPVDPKQYTAVINGARFGSFSRGAETINGGVVSKSVIRIGSNYTVMEKDCGTKFGIRKNYTKDNIHTLVGRSIIENDKTVLIEKIEQAGHYLDKTVIVRSPACCQAGKPTTEKKTSEDKLCKVCAGTALSQFEEGLAIPLTEVSHLILNQSLKAMHGKTLTTAQVDLPSVLT